MSLDCEHYRALLQEYLSRLGKANSHLYSITSDVKMLTHSHTREAETKTHTRSTKQATLHIYTGTTIRHRSLSTQITLFFFLQTTHPQGAASTSMMNKPLLKISFDSIRMLFLAWPWERTDQLSTRITACPAEFTYDIFVDMANSFDTYLLKPQRHLCML